MADVVRLVRVFLASPGDLADERRLVKETEGDLNSGIAAYLGFRVELKGWEDTLSGSGRPQALINQELNLCELFIGMMWRRWGTPPSLDGKYSSGFEEEFERSSLRLKETNKPEMAMYFKEIDPDLLKDPGEDLKKVLAFKKCIIAEKAIYYENFAEPNELQKRVRQKIENYLIGLRTADEESQEEEQAKTKGQIEVPDTAQDKEVSKSPFSQEGHEFLRSFLENAVGEEGAESITPLKVARFRLLSSILTKAGNDESYFGVHDANIVFANRQISFGRNEISRLIDCGLENLENGNVPLWHWYARSKQIKKEDHLIVRSFSDNDVGVGALDAISLIALTPELRTQSIERDSIIKLWLSEEWRNTNKLAALRYLRRHGQETDLTHIQSELDRGDSGTSRAALEAKIAIEFRCNKADALKSAITNQFDSFDDNLLEELLSKFADIDEDHLKLGMSHRNERIRIESIRRLNEIDGIGDAEIKDLGDDPSAKVRFETVKLLLARDHSLSDDTARGILVKTRRRNVFTAFSRPGLYDAQGQAYYDRYLFSKYCEMPERELVEVTAGASIYKQTAYFALCDRYFGSHQEELRRQIDSQFKDKFDAHIEYITEIGSTEEDIQSSKNLENHLRKELTRQGLDILCKKGQVTDLGRIRANMRSDFVKSSAAEIEYLRKHGEWEDLQYLVSAEDESATLHGLTMALPSDRDWYGAIAGAAYSIGADRLDDLLIMEMPDTVLKELIRTTAISRFAEISHATLFSLWHKKDDGVRKFAALKGIQAFTKTKIRSQLQQYVDREGYRYYNVIHWLDFGASLPLSTTRTMASQILEG